MTPREADPSPRLAAAPRTRVRGYARSGFVELLAAREQHVPVGAERLHPLAVCISFVFVLDEEVQRVPVVGHLTGPVVARDRAERRTARAHSCRGRGAGAHG